MTKELLKGKAKFQQISNDLFWDCCLLSYDKNNGIEFFHVEWKGYNDTFWWNNVSEKASTVTCIGEKGTFKKFKLNYETLDVTEVEE